MSTEVKIFQLALERLMDDVEQIKTQNVEFKTEIDNLKNQNGNNVVVQKESLVDETVLIDTKEVLQILGICYNTLQSIIDKGELKAIRINQRRIRFSKAQLVRYIESKQ